MNYTKRVKAMTRTSATNAQKFFKLTSNRIFTFLKSEKGGMTIDATLMAANWAATFWPDSALLSLLRVALFWLSKLKGDTD